MNAGKIAYKGSLGTQALSIVGAGKSVGTRAIKMWDNVEVAGNVVVGGTLAVGGTLTSVLNTLSVKNGQNEFSYNGESDVVLKNSARADSQGKYGGRALTHDANNTLTINFANDFTGGVNIGGRLTVPQGIIQRGSLESGLPITTDLGLYSLQENFSVRFVTNNGPFYFFTNPKIGFDPIIQKEVASIGIDGTLTAKTKQFKITHPNRAGFDLIHSCLEGPENGVYYRGEGRLVAGQAVVMLPDYFEALTRPEGVTVQLTPKGPWPFLLSYSDVSGGSFHVHGTQDDGAFAWELKAVRGPRPAGGRGPLGRARRSRGGPLIVASRPTPTPPVPASWPRRLTPTARPTPPRPTSRACGRRGSACSSSSPGRRGPTTTTTTRGSRSSSSSATP